MSRSKPDDTPIATLIDNEETWKTISGEAAEKDFLHVVEIYSSWCGASEAINSTLKRLNMELVGRKIRFFKMEATLVPEFESIKTTSRPHFALFKDGEQCELIEGINAPLLEKFIGDLLPESLLDVEESGDQEAEEED
mmetsp:Transcript_51551/g.102595  ORF Transcript_51551/g.102595 Transcript_51551/m.102595 type:complete len:138 (-) Transcript_51551:322-735(-)|eukprot:CAMPEP_0174694042 /NCGR_PEP_ID=MMETSP1094-20130205/674_1 /TAXON_ID=156173 /ORGANISM="Chrysochromulina brevifilum, Strain UTEX LB 985" /LENGTH=137 /DNA_ID=CAMNT_0015890149 /DNA_START=69 /DNA_END=482 /DNA_ORIENTATION=+